MSDFTSFYLTAAAATVAASLGCSPAPGNNDAGTGVTTSGSGGESAAGGAGTGTGGAVYMQGSGGAIFNSAGGMVGTEDLDGGCFSTGSAAEQITTTMEVTVTTYSPVDIFIMYDQSGSMDGETPVGTRWDAIKAALTGFVNDPNSQGISIGIGYFPYVDPAAPGFCFQTSDCGAFGPCVQLFPPVPGGFCQGADACLPSMYDAPDVPISPLPTAATQIINSLNAHGPNGGTPTAPALAGAHQYALQWAQSHPDTTTVVVLATDGDPSGCNANTVQDVANVAAAGLNGTPSIQTFVIGVGSSLTSLNSIAAAGGTNQALIVDAANGNPTQQFLDAMNAIRDAVTTTMQTQQTVTAPVPCEWSIPPAPGGMEFDKNLVNVDFTAGASAPQRIGAVGSAADCANVSGGWHYDNVDAPTKVLVCPNTCQTIQSIGDARIDVVFGCATEPAVIQ